jgi:GT2 family glycosyltransferase
MDLSIIIVNWNVKSLLERCLVSILKTGTDVDYEIIVIDNASTDNSQEFLSKFKNENPKSKIILNQKNLGFAKAVNQGLGVAEAELILLLNPDTEVLPETLSKIVKFMHQYPRCGVLGGKILNFDGSIQPSVRSFPTLFSQILILLKLHNFFPRLKPLKDYFLLDFDYSKRQLVDQVSGAFLATRTEVIKKIGGFDERFFLWFEEVDFCFRAKRAGWEVIYTPDIYVNHYGKRSFSQILPINRQIEFNRSLFYYFKKHQPKRDYYILSLFYPISLFLALIVQIFYLSKNKRYGRG